MAGIPFRHDVIADHPFPMNPADLELLVTWVMPYGTRPFGVVYRASGVELLVVALANSRRKPEYWADRDQQRMAVRRGLGDDVAADGGQRARAIFDDHRLAQ